MSTPLSIVARAEWPESTVDTTLPGLPGFIDSTFSPLVAATAERCLARAYGEPPATGDRTAIVLVSPLGDVTSAVKVSKAVDTGGRVAPLLFFQSVPNAVAGYLAARWGLLGPLVCLGSDDDGLDLASLLIDDGDADEALVVRATVSTVDSEPDRALAVLVRADRKAHDEGVDS